MCELDADQRVAFRREHGGLATLVVSIRMIQKRRDERASRRFPGLGERADLARRVDQGSGVKRLVGLGGSCATLLDDVVYDCAERAKRQQAVVRPRELAGGASLKSSDLAEAGVHVALY